MKTYFKKFILLLLLLGASVSSWSACDKATSLSATVSGSSVNFTWSGNGTSYLIEIQNTVTNSTVVPEKSVASPYTHILPDGSYKFKIRTICGNDKSNWTDWVSFTLNGAPAGGSGGTPTSCNIPTALTASVSGDQVSLTWAGTATSYQIEVENESTGIKAVPEQTASSPFVITLANGSYKFKVRSICGADQSNWSAFTSFVVGTSNPNGGGNGGGGGTGSTCSVPTALGASFSGDQVSLTWTGTATSYQIEVENESTGIKAVPEQTASSPFVITLANGSYKFKVRSICGADQSNWSAFTSFVVGTSNPNGGGNGGGGGTGSTCSVPTALGASVSGDQVSLTWTGTATSYQIEVENESTGIKAVPEQTASSPFVITLANGSYKFKVRSICGADQSNWSAFTSFVVGTSNPNGGGNGGGGGAGSTCSVPTALGASVSGDQVSLTWTGTATSYQIEVENESTGIKAVPEQTASSPFVITLANGSYKFKVRSVCGADQSNWSAFTSFVVSSSNPNGGGGVACILPSQLTSTVNGQSVVFAWKGSSGQYKIEVENVLTEAKVIPEQLVANPFITTLASGTYKFKIKGICGDTQTVWSNWSFFKTGNDSSIITPAVPIDSNCKNTVILKLVNARDSSLQLSWNKSGIGIYTIEVESEHLLPAFRFRIEDFKDTTILVSGLIPGVQYKISVTTNCSNGRSSQSSTISSVTPLPAPPVSPGLTKFSCTVPVGVTVIIRSATQALLSWLPIPGVANFQVEVEAQENTPELKRNAGVNGNALLIENLIPGGIYKFKVRTACTFSKSNYSTPVLIEMPVSLVGLENRSAIKTLQFDIYPNPASSYTRIRVKTPGTPEPCEIQIINIAGQLISSFKNTDIHQTTFTIPLSQYDPGVYFVRVWAGQRQSIEKLIVR